MAKKIERSPAAAAPARKLSEDGTVKSAADVNDAVQEDGFPFQTKADLFDSPNNLAHLKKVADDLNAGRNLVRQNLIED